MKVRLPEASRKKVKKPSHTSFARKCEIHVPTDYPWKVLGACVKDHEAIFTDDEHALLTQIIRDRDIHAYLSLTDIWGLQNTVSINSDDFSYHAFRGRYQVASLLKKFCFPTEESAQVAAAKQTFTKAEANCELYNHSGYEKLVWGKTEYEAEVFTYAKSFLQKVLGDTLPPFATLSEWSRHGPGSNLDTKNGLNSAYHKYLRWPYSCTTGAVRFARLLIQSDKRWIGALEDSYRTCFNIPKHAILNQKVFWETVIAPVESNRICFVPKNALTKRTIAKEPAMNLMLQLGVDGFIRRRLKRWGVDLDDQTKNQRLAGLGSTDDSKDGFVTLDLSAASDSVSLKICELVLPPSWYSYLVNIRSPKWCMDDGSTGVYAKISSMGNGYTFALESALFAAVIYAVMKAERGVTDTEKFAVYGDDLIVQKKYAQGVIDLLSRFGFTLNLEKSFLKGPIRESCGADWLNGKPIRPIFMKEQPTSVKHLLRDRNRLMRAYHLNTGLFGAASVELIDRWLPDIIRKDFRYHGPLSDEDFDTYIHDPIPRRWLSTKVEKPWHKGNLHPGSWVYSRLVDRSLELPAKDFLMRKLMHDLRDVPVCLNPWDDSDVGGNRFSVKLPKAAALSTISTRTDIWCEDYHFATPAFARG